MDKSVKWLIIFVIASLASLLSFPLGISWWKGELISVLSAFLVTFIPIVIDFINYEISKHIAVKNG